MHAAAGPADAKLISPGLAFASAISSLTVLTGSDGCTVTMNGVFATRMIGAMSLMGSNESL